MLAVTNFLSPAYLAFFSFKQNRIWVGTMPLSVLANLNFMSGVKPMVHVYSNT